MKTLNDDLRTVLLSFCLINLFLVLNPVSAQVQIKERNILATEAKEINLNNILLTDNSWNKLPDYKNRTFWQGLPANIREVYISKGEKYIDYSRF